jgi:hypothetical protein
LNPILVAQTIWQSECRNRGAPTWRYLPAGITQTRKAPGPPPETRRLEINPEANSMYDDTRMLVKCDLIQRRTLMTSRYRNHNVRLRIVTKSGFGMRRSRLFAQFGASLPEGPTSVC